MVLRRSAFGILALLTLLMGACSSPATIPTGQMTDSPTIDGSLDDWGGRLTYVGDRPVSMSVLPTDSLLYVALSIQDPELVRAVAANGLTVWVDPTGKQKRNYGIRYPLGLRYQRSGESASGDASSVQTRNAMFERVSLSELEVVRGDSARRRIPARFSSGLRSQATLGPGSLIYELAVPVGNTAVGSGERRYGLQATLGKKVGIGIETPEPDEDRQRVVPQQGVPSVTGQPGRRGRRGRTGRRRQQRRPSPQRPDRPNLDLWVQVASDGAR